MRTAQLKGEIYSKKRPDDHKNKDRRA